MNVSDENNTAEANDENSTPSAKHTDIKHLGIIYAFFTTKTELTKEIIQHLSPKEHSFIHFLFNIYVYIFLYIYITLEVYIYIHI